MRIEETDAKASTICSGLKKKHKGPRPQRVVHGKFRAQLAIFVPMPIMALRVEERARHEGTTRERQGDSKDRAASRMHVDAGEFDAMLYAAAGCQGSDARCFGTVRATGKRERGERGAGTVPSAGGAVPSAGFVPSGRQSAAASSARHS
jgi:hypothetical protein